MDNSRFEEELETLYSRVIGGEGRLDIEVRLAIANNGGVPEAFKALTHKVHEHAYRVTDDDVGELIAKEYDEEEVFEAVVSGAVGAAAERWQVFSSLLREVENAS